MQGGRSPNKPHSISPVFESIDMLNSLYIDEEISLSFQLPHGVVPIKSRRKLSLQLPIKMIRLPSVTEVQCGGDGRPI
jgi:hypothetical protein